MKRIFVLPCLLAVIALLASLNPATAASREGGGCTIGSYIRTPHEHGVYSWFAGRYYWFVPSDSNYNPQCGSLTATCRVFMERKQGSSWVTVDDYDETIPPVTATPQPPYYNCYVEIWASNGGPFDKDNCPIGSTYRSRAVSTIRKNGNLTIPNAPDVTRLSGELTIH